MSSFTEAVVQRTDHNCWTVKEPFVYHVGGYPSPTGWQVHIPAGFECDLVTLPLGLRWAIDRDSLATASVIHDYLLTVEGFSRTIADAVFFEACLNTPNISKRTALIAYLGVLGYSVYKYLTANKKKKTT